MNLLLRKFRKQYPMTQEQLADAVTKPDRPITKRIIGTYERGETPIPLDVAVDITEVLGITLDELVGRSVEHVYSDKGQEIVNICYESMNDRGKSTLVSVAQSMERDVANRVVKNGAEIAEGESREDVA